MKDNMTFAEKDLANLLQALQTQLSPVKTDTGHVNDLMILVSSRTLGHGDEELGKILLKFFLNSLTSRNEKPKTIILLNDAVLLASENSQILGSFTALLEQGIKILIDGTSVDYYQMEGKIKIGQVVSMFAICSEIMEAGRILSL